MSVAFHIIQELVLKERLFLRHKLKLEEICRRLNTNPRALNAALKQHGFHNFAHFLNYFRVEEVKKMMAEDAFHVYTLEAIAAMAGFGTRQAFYNTFEKLTGQRPGRFRNYIKKNQACKEENMMPCNTSN